MVDGFGFDIDILKGNGKGCIFNLVLIKPVKHVRINFSIIFQSNNFNICKQTAAKLNKEKTKNTILLTSISDYNISKIMKQGRISLLPTILSSIKVFTSKLNCEYCTGHFSDFEA